jgi:hypothetical protein
MFVVNSRVEFDGLKLAVKPGRKSGDAEIEVLMLES